MLAGGADRVCLTCKTPWQSDIGRCVCCGGMLNMLNISAPPPSPVEALILAKLDHLQATVDRMERKVSRMKTGH